MWFDLFSNNQINAPSLDFEWWTNTFKSSIKVRFSAISVSLSLSLCYLFLALYFAKFGFFFSATDYPAPVTRMHYSLRLLLISPLPYFPFHVARSTTVALFRPLIQNLVSMLSLPPGSALGVQSWSWHLGATRFLSRVRGACLRYTAL